MICLFVVTYIIGYCIYLKILFKRERSNYYSYRFTENQSLYSAIIKALLWPNTAIFDLVKWLHVVTKFSERLDNLSTKLCEYLKK